MTATSRPGQLVASLVGAVDGAARAIGRAGVAAFGWPVVVGMGLGTGLFGLARPDFVASMLARRATTVWMRAALTSVAVCVAVVTVSALVIAWLRFRRHGAGFHAEYLRVLRTSAVLAALPLVVAVGQPLAPEREWLVLAFALTTAAFTAYSYYASGVGRAALATTRPAVRRVALAIVGSLSAALAYRAASLGIGNHLSFNTGRADLGFYVNKFREASQGHLFACTLCENGRYDYVHLEPIVTLLSPLYLLYPAAQLLIGLQSVVLASGAIPVFLLAERGAGVVPGAALALAYLLYPPLAELALFDFHAVSLAVPLCLWLLWALEQERVRTYFVLALLLLTIREDMGFVLAGVGAYALTNGRAKVGWATLLLAGAGLAVMHFVAQGGVTRTFVDVFTEATSRRRARAMQATDPTLVLVQRALTDEKALHAAELLSPLLGLSLLARGRVLLLYGAVVAAVAALSLPASPQAQQAALVVPFVFFLAAKALASIVAGRSTYGLESGPALGRALALGIVVCTLYQAYVLGPFMREAAYRAGPRVLARHPSKESVALDRDLRKLSVSWPKGAKVAASSDVSSHLGSASHLYALDDRAGTDYVVASMKQRNVARHIGAEEADGQLERVFTSGDVRVYRSRYRGPLPRRARQIEDE